jgi:hypothetical protein
MVDDMSTSQRALRICTLAPLPSTQDVLPNNSAHIQGFISKKMAAPPNSKGPSPRGLPCVTPNMALSKCQHVVTPWHAHFQRTCNACGQWGHQANTCNNVGAWVFLQYFHRDRGNLSLVDKAEKAWIEKNNAYLKDHAASPRKFSPCTATVGA